MFEGIGRIGAYAALQNMRLEAKYKLKTGKSLKELKDQLREAMNESLRTSQPRKTKMADSTKVSIIRQKLRQGRKLSANELKYLKETDESLYDKAKKAETAREELQQALKRAKSKDEARQAVMQAQMKVAAEAQLDAKGGGALSCGAGLGGAASLAAPNINTQVEAINTGEGATANPPAGSTSENSPAAEAQSPAADHAAAQDTQNTQDNRPTDSEDDKSPFTPSSASNFDGEIPGEKYIFMLAAIQDEWRKFIHTKDFDELPERDIDVYNKEVKPKKSHKPAYKKALDEEMSILYRTQPQDLLPGDLLDLRAKL